MAIRSETTKNLLLATGSLVLIFLLSLAVDFFVGRTLTRPETHGGVDLIFPPFAQQTFTSLEFTYTVYTNSLGLREREMNPGSEAIRIAAVGNSFTYGWGVSAQETWLRYVENRMREDGWDVETVNMGKPGARPPLYAEIAERAIPIVQPDILIIGLLQGTDLAGSGPDGIGKIPETPWVLSLSRRLYPNITRALQNARVARMHAARRQEMPPQVTRAEDNRRWAENTARDFHARMSDSERARFERLEPKVKEAFLRGLLNPFMIDLALKNPRIYIGPVTLTDPWTQASIDHMSHYLLRIKKVAEQYGARVVALSIPDGPYANTHVFNNIRRLGYETDATLMTPENADAGIRIACERAGVPLITVSENFAAHRDDPTLYYELDTHFTPAGHRLFGELVTPRLLRLLP